MRPRPPLDDRHAVHMWAVLEGVRGEALDEYRAYADGGPVPRGEQHRERARRRRIKAADRAAVLTPGVLCAYCETRVADTVDHVVPVASGGTSERSNLVPACWPCNRLKCHLPATDEFKDEMKDMAEKWNELLENIPTDSPLGLAMIRLMRGSAG